MTEIFDAILQILGAGAFIVYLGFGLLLFFIGGLFFVWFFYARFSSRRVSARIVAVRMTGAPIMTEAERAQLGAVLGPDEVPEISWKAFGTEFKKSPGTGLLALFVAFIIVAVPAGFVGFGLWSGNDRMSLLVQGLEAPGVVTDIESHRGSEQTMYSAVVTFKDEKGRAWVVKESLSQSGAAFFSRGEKVIVHYDPENPRHMVVGGLWHNVFLALVFVLMGSLFLFLIFLKPEEKKEKSSAGRPSRADYSNEMYHPVMEYHASDGSVVRAEGNISSSRILNKIPGRRIYGYVREDRPDTVEQPGFFTLLFSLLFAGPGLWLFWIAYRQYESNIYTLVFALGFLMWIGLGFKKIIKPRDQWDTKQSFQQKRREKRMQERGEGRILTMPEIRERARAQDRILKRWLPFYILLATTVLVGGAHLERNMNDFLVKAVSAPAEIVGTDNFFGSSQGDRYYHAVVSFRTGEGQNFTIRDKWGGSAPLYKRGDRVRVLYDPAVPGQALIDRGFMNHAAARIVMLAGFLIMALSLKSYAGLRERSRL